MQICLWLQIGLQTVPRGKRGGALDTPLIIFNPDDSNTYGDHVKELKDVLQGEETIFWQHLYTRRAAKSIESNKGLLPSTIGNTVSCLLILSSVNVLNDLDTCWIYHCGACLCFCLRRKQIRKFTVKLS